MGQSYRRACVTGGAGFIGSHLVRALLESGLEVCVLDNVSVGRKQNVAPGASLFVGDILDSDSVTSAMAGCDIVFHLAARVAIRSSFEFVVSDATTNFAGTASVLRAAQQSGSVRKFIAASSMAVYSDAPGPAPINEEFATNPVSPYGISKLAMERLVHVMCAAASIESVVLRLFNTYGPGQAYSPYVGVVTIFVNRLLNGENPTIYGDGEQSRDFVQVHDVVRGFLRAMDAPVTGETFNIGTGVATSVNSVLRTLNTLFGTSFPGEHVPPVSGELRYSVADIGKARHKLGFEPDHRFTTSIGSVVREIQSIAS
ncbi:MAG: NAD-dependent epimerase/dehydratase family protein [Candidatus Acidiferrum sp.]